MLPCSKAVPSDTSVADAAVLAGVDEPCRVVWDDTPVSGHSPSAWSRRESSLSCPLSNDSNEKQTGTVVDRTGNAWVVFDLDGTREAARVSRPAPDRGASPALISYWMTFVPPATPGASEARWCEHARSKASRTAESRLGSFGNRGNGRYRTELRQGLSAIARYLTAHQLPQERARLAARWAIWHRGRTLRREWFRRSSPRQRLHRARSSPRQRQVCTSHLINSSSGLQSQSERSLYDWTAGASGV
jgi:hypothetical protein